jgi:hypothetical protein
VKFSRVHFEDNGGQLVAYRGIEVSSSTAWLRLHTPTRIEPETAASTMHSNLKPET